MSFQDGLRGGCPAITESSPETRQGVEPMEY